MSDAWMEFDESDLEGRWEIVPEGRHDGMQIVDAKLGYSSKNDRMVTIEMSNSQGITLIDRIMLQGKGKPIGLRKLIGMGITRAPMPGEKMAVPNPDSWVYTPSFSVYVMHTHEDTYDTHGNVAIGPDGKKITKIFANVDINCGTCGYDAQPDQQEPDPAAPSEEEEREFEQQSSNSTVDDDEFDWRTGVGK